MLKATRLPNNTKYQRAIVCGAPERAKLVSSRLENVETVAKRREYHSYLGKYKSQEVLVISHGVGAAGAMICFRELIDAGIQTVIRIGSAGGLYENVQIGDIVIPTAAVRLDGVTPRMIPLEYPAAPDFHLTYNILNAMHAKNLFPRTGIIISTDLFYPGLLDCQLELYQKANAIAVEMETSALFIAGSLYNIKTASILTVDGNPLKWEKEKFHNSQAPEFSTSIEQCIDIALNVLIAN